MSRLRSSVTSTRSACATSASEMSKLTSPRMCRWVVNPECFQTGDPLDVVVTAQGFAPSVGRYC